MTESPTPRTALLIGASGFLGRHVAAQLRAEGWTVRAASGAALTDAPEATWDSLTRGAQAIVNAAGLTAGTLPDLTRANVLLVAQALGAATRADLPLVHLSSAAEYGRTPHGHASREDDPARPLSPYGASKLAGTTLIEEAVRSGRVQAAALRLTNPLGAGLGEGTLPGRAAATLRAARAAGQRSVRFGPLGAYRDFVDARDVARAVTHTLTVLPQGALGGAVNVGSGEARPVRDIVTGLAAQLGYDGEVLEDAPGSPRSGDVPWQQASLDRLHASGFSLRHTFTDALNALLNPDAHPDPGTVPA